MKFSQRITSEHAACRSSGGSEWGEGGRKKSMYIHILELFLYMTMLLEAVPVYIKATSITAKAYLSEIYINSSIHGNFWILEGLNSKVGRDSHNMIVSRLDVNSYNISLACYSTCH